MELLCIPISVPKFTIHSHIITENTDNVNNILIIYIGIIHYSYQCEFLPILQVSSHEGNIVEAHVKC